MARLAKASDGRGAHRVIRPIRALQHQQRELHRQGRQQQRRARRAAQRDPVLEEALRRRGPEGVERAEAEEAEGGGVVLRS